MKSYMLEPLFNKVAGCACVFADKKLQHRYLLVNSAKVSRPFILYNTCDRLLLLSVFTIYFSFKCFLTVTHFSSLQIFISMVHFVFIQMQVFEIFFYDSAFLKQGRRKTGGGQGGGGRGDPLPMFFRAKFFFPRKIGKHSIFTCE